MRLRWVWVGLFALSVGCDGCQESEEATAPPAPVVEEPPPSESEATSERAPLAAAPEAPPAPERSAEIPAEVRRAARLLGEGRRLARTGKWPEAVAKFRESLELATNARTLCELGWALYQTGAYEEARGTLTRGVGRLRGRAERRPDEVNTLGACLYNLGRVAEESDSVAAAALYAESVSIRPNATVQARLDALGVPLTPDCEPRACVGPFEGEPQTALSAALGRHYASEDVDIADVGDGDAFVFRGAAPHKEAGIFLGLRSEDAWYACHLQPELSDSYTFPESIRRRQWVAGGRPEIDFEVEEAWHGREDGVGNSMGDVVRYFIGWSEDAPVVYGGIRTLSFYYDGEWTDCGEGECLDGNDEVIPDWMCCDTLTPIENITRWNVRSIGSGRVRVERVEGEGRGPRVRTVDLTSLACSARD